MQINYPNVMRPLILEFVRQLQETPSPYLTANDISRRMIGHAMAELKNLDIALEHGFQRTADKRTMKHYTRGAAWQSFIDALSAGKGICCDCGQICDNMELISRHTKTYRSDCYVCQSCIASDAGRKEHEKRRKLDEATAFAGLANENLDIPVRNQFPFIG